MTPTNNPQQNEDTRTCENGHTMTGIGFDDCPECGALWKQQKEDKIACQCCCHTNILKKPYHHDTKCCNAMNGSIQQNESWKKKIENKFSDKLSSVLEDNFPKHQCKERSQALVLNAFANVYLREALQETLNEAIEAIKNIEEWEQTYCEKDEYLFNAIRSQLLQTLEELKK